MKGRRTTLTFFLLLLSTTSATTRSLQVRNHEEEEGSPEHQQQEQHQQTKFNQQQQQHQHQETVASFENSLGRTTTTKASLSASHNEEDSAVGASRSSSNTRTVSSSFLRKGRQRGLKKKDEKNEDEQQDQQPQNETTTTTEVVNEGEVDEPTIILNATEKIVGGMDAQPNDFPCYVQAGTGGCGGAFIWKDIVLTAAHCRATYADGAYIGAYQYRSLNYGAEYRKVERVVVHPNFDSQTFHYDFSIVKLLNTPKGDHKYCQINRKAGGYPESGSSLIAIGLGDLSENSGRSPTYLQKVWLKAVTTQTCAKDYSQLNDKVFADTMICLSGGAKKDTCYGDSGGPVFDVPDRKVVGLTSWGQECASARYPGVYTKVASAAKWIDEMICQLSRKGPAKCSESFKTKNQKKKKRKKQKRSSRNRHHNYKDDKNRTLLEEENVEDEYNTNDNMELTVDDVDAAAETNCHNTNSLFDVDEDSSVVDKDCEWLETNRNFWKTNKRRKDFSSPQGETDGYDDLCDHLYIASKCPQTCRVCDLLNSDTGLLEY